MTRIKNRICAVAPDSIALELGIEAGDCLICVNQTPVIDVFDYRMRTTVNDVLLEIEKQSGEIVEYEIEKDEYDDIGMEFDDVLMDDGKGCSNKCVFCFIDQLPKDMRESLYFKDDDLRLSFLTGNYVTLTNQSDKELDRLISYKLSPMNISVHTTNPSLRIEMMRNKNAGNIFNQLKKIAVAGIMINCQIVLCPGINDGDAFEQTLSDLFALGNQIQSIAAVPVGLTKFRAQNGTAHLKPFGQSSAKKIIETITNYQQKMLSQRGERIVFASDELYIKAGMPVPDASSYDDFPQLENGVGMVSLFLKEMQDEISSRIDKSGEFDLIVKNLKNENNLENEMLDENSIGHDNHETGNGNGTGKNIEAKTGKKKIIIITGVDAQPFIEKFTSQLGALYNSEFVVKAIRNEFFGESVTVAGLLTGSDIIRELSSTDYIGIYDMIIIPSCMLRAGEKVFLDDVTVSDVKKALRIHVEVASPDAEGLFNRLDDIFKIKKPKDDRNRKRLN